MKAYLDIETSFEGGITIVGLYDAARGFRQLVGGEVTDVGLCRALEGADTLCTYNGEAFDLPVIRRRLGVDLRALYRSHDLLRDCRRLKITGGLKGVERLLGIPRATAGLDGYEAMRLWARYVNDYDEEALAILRTYNREDVMNLTLLEARLALLVGRDADRV
jgi:uncharacterized protein YprB with RNaseH-like and TPR domain